MLSRFILASSVVLVVSVSAATVACSSSSSNPPSTDAGMKDVAVSHDSGKHGDAGHPKSDAGHEAGAVDAGIGITCGKLLLCDQPCSSNACTNACYAEATGVAQGLFNALDNCINEQCQGDAGSSCQQSAATGACVSHLLACEGDMSVGPPDPDGGGVVVPEGGTGGDAGAKINCGSLVSCEGACGDAGASCASSCVGRSTPTAQALANDLNNCLSAACPTTDGGTCATAGSTCTGCRTQAEFDQGTCGMAFSTCQSDDSNAPDASTSPVALLGGTIVTLAAGLNQPQVVIVQSGRVYYSQVSATGPVSDVSLVDAGAPANVSASQPYPMGLAVDSAHVYVWNSGSFSGSTTLNNSDGTVVQFPLAGGTGVTLASGLEVAYAAPYLNAITVSGSNVYWVAGASGHDGTIMTAPVSSSGAATSLYTNQPFPEAVVTDGTNLYWSVWGTFTAGGAYNNDGAVLKGPIAGGSVTTLASGQSAPGAIAVDANNVYWTNAGRLGGDNLPAPGTGSVMQVSKSGTGLTALSTGDAIPLSLTVSSTTVYWNEYTLSAPGQILSVPIGGGSRVAVAAGLANPFGITLAGQTLVWSDSPPTQAGSGKILALTLP